MARRAGRQRKLASRYPNGRLMPDAREESRREAKSVVLTARCVHLGMQPTQDNQDRVDQPMLGDVIGRLRLLRRITEPQYDAAASYLRAYIAWRRANATPSRFPKGASIERVSGRGGDVERDGDERASEAFMDAKHVLMAAGLHARRAVEGAVLEDVRVSVFSLRVGLSALAEHFGLTKQRR